MQLFGSRSVSFTCAVLLSCTSIRVFSGKVIHALHDGEEDAKMFHRLARLAIHADGLHVEMDAFFALTILFEGSLLKHCGASSVCVRILCVCFLKNLRGSSVPVVVRMAGLPSVVLPGLF